MAMSIPTLGIPVPRRPSVSASRSAFELSGAPAASFEGLPSAQGLADLELVRASSRASLKQQAYKGGGGLELTRSRNPALPLKRIITGPTPQTIPESPIETSGADETHGDDATKVGEEQSDKSESAEERHTRKMYERFSERHKSFIVAIVAYAALLARTYNDCSTMSPQTAHELSICKQPSHHLPFFPRFHPSWLTSTHRLRLSMLQSPSLLSRWPSFPSLGHPMRDWCVSCHFRHANSIARTDCLSTNAVRSSTHLYSLPPHLLPWLTRGRPFPQPHLAHHYPYHPGNRLFCRPLCRCRYYR